MQTLYKVITEDEKALEVKLQIIKSESNADGRLYGILAKLISNGITIETESVENRFFTYEEAAKATDMLSSYQVTPCTLKDVL